MRTRNAQPDRTVMIVDDEQVVRDLLRAVLEQNGFTVVAEASDGIEAVAGYLQSRPWITLMDVCMPNKNGLEATREIVSHDEHAKVVLVSGIHGADLEKTAREAGAQDALVKPFKIKELKVILQRIMGG